MTFQIYRQLFFTMIILTLGHSIAPGQIVPDFPINPDTVNGQYGPDIAVGEDGDFTFVWGSASDVYLAIFDSLGVLSKGPQVITPSTIIGMGARPEISKRGDYAVVTWGAIHNDPASEANVGGRLLTRGGDPISGNLFVSFSRYGDYFPDVAYINDSTFCLVWYHFYSHVQTMTNSLRLVGDPQKVQDDSIHVDRISRPYISASPEAGRGVVVWWDNRTGQSQLYARRLDWRGIPQDTSFLVSENLSAPEAKELVLFCSVDMDVAGNFVVAWVGRTDTVFNVFMRRYDPDGMPLGQIVKVNESSDLGYIVYETDVAFDANGSFVVVWEEPVVSFATIFAQRFAADGTPIEGNFSITPPDTVHKYSPAVALRHGKIYTTWEASVRDKPQIWANVLDFERPLSASEKVKQIPTRFYLNQNYPNPFNSTTVISFDLYQVQPVVTLSIYDVLGRLVQEFVQQNLDPGRYWVVWDGKDGLSHRMPSGVYLYRLSMDRQTQLKKMLFIK